MSIWFAIPSARPAEEAAKRLVKWVEQGYRIALLRQGEPVPAHLTISTDQYLGWANSTNILCREILARDPEAEWIVGGGDDYLPDPTHRAEDIARECTAHFGGTFGVMQPTGDRWCQSSDGTALIDRICGSPWMGREWCSRMYGGRGPMFPDYWHLYADEELQYVAVKLGRLWQRRDLIQYHDHALREHGGQLPEFLKPINAPESWRKHQALFNARRATGWPGHEPLPIAVEPA